MSAGSSLRSGEDAGRQQSVHCIDVQQYALCGLSLVRSERLPSRVAAKLAPIFKLLAGLPIPVKRLVTLTVSTHLVSTYPRPAGKGEGLGRGTLHRGKKEAPPKPHPVRVQMSGVTLILKEPYWWLTRR